MLNVMMALQTIWVASYVDTKTFGWPSIPFMIYYGNTHWPSHSHWMIPGVDNA